MSGAGETVRLRFRLRAGGAELDVESAVPAEPGPLGALLPALHPIADGVVAVGAHRDDDNGSDSGSAYLFDATTGAQIAKLLPDDGEPNDQFGMSIAIADGVVAVGAVLRDGNADDSGSVYLFDEAPSVAFRNAGTNPDSFTSGTAWVGGDLNFTVDVTTTGHTHALVIAFDSPFEVQLGGGQTLLCLDLLGGGELLNTGFHEGPLVSIDLPVPPLPQLVSLELYTQAVHAFGVSPFALSNSQDLVVGGCSLLPSWEDKLLLASGETLLDQDAGLDPSPRVDLRLG